VSNTVKEDGMKKRKLLIAGSLAIALVGGSGTLVWASLNETPALPCSDVINGQPSYTPPKQQVDSLGRPTWVTDGLVSFTMTLAAPSCLDVSYGFVALAEDPTMGNGTPTVLASSTVPGDGTSTKIGFELPVTSDTSQGKVCIYVYTFGGGGEPNSNKNGAAFDGTSGATLLDRAPDGPTEVEGDPGASSAYCLLTGTGGQGYH
jgi:hypothetical protein